MGMIMELPSMRVLSKRVVVAQTWTRVKLILYVVFPICMVGGLLLAIMHYAGLFKPVETIFAPLTVWWLGLPAIASVLLLFGVVRKELVVIMPTMVFDTANLAEVFTPAQMIVLAFVTMIYVPCVATFVMLKNEFGWKTTLYITVFEVAFAVALGGAFFRLLSVFRIV